MSHEPNELHHVLSKVDADIYLSSCWRNADPTGQIANPLLDGMRPLFDLLPDPWNKEFAAAYTQEDLTQALDFLAHYPFAFVGFLNEVLAHLATLPLDEQQKDLLQRCLQWQAHPFERPGSTH